MSHCGLVRKFQFFFISFFCASLFESLSPQFSFLRYIVKLWLLTMTTTTVVCAYIRSLALLEEEGVWTTLIASKANERACDIEEKQRSQRKSLSLSLARMEKIKLFSSSQIKMDFSYWLDFVPAARVLSTCLRFSFFIFFFHSVGRRERRYCQRESLTSVIFLLAQSKEERKRFFINSIKLLSDKVKF